MLPVLFIGSILAIIIQSPMFTPQVRVPQEECGAKAAAKKELNLISLAVGNMGPACGSRD